MAITPINPISNLGDAASQKKKNSQPNNCLPTAGASMTEKLMNSVNSRSERSPEYEKEAFDYLRSFYRQNGHALDSYMQCQTNFVLTARISDESVVQFGQLYGKMKKSSGEFKDAITCELSSLQAAGLDDTNAKVDAIIGLQHLYGNAACAVLLYSEIFLGASSDKRQSVLDQMEPAMLRLVEMHEKLSALSKHPEYANQFLFSEISAQHVDMKV